MQDAHRTGEFNWSYPVQQSAFSLGNRAQMRNPHRRRISRHNLRQLNQIRSSRLLNIKSD